MPLKTPGETAAFVDEIKELLPKALEKFPEAFEKEMGRLITREEAAQFVPLIQEIFLNSIDEFLRIYSEKDFATRGVEWEKLSTLICKNLKTKIRENDLAGTLDGIVLEGGDLVFNSIYQQYFAAREIGSTTFF